MNLLHPRDKHVGVIWGKTTNYWHWSSLDVVKQRTFDSLFEAAWMLAAGDEAMRRLLETSMSSLRLRQRAAPKCRNLRVELLEERQLLAITVNTLLDEADGSIVDGDISLRDALSAASAGETIDFDASLDGGTILLTLGELRVTRALAIDGSLLPSGITIDASGNDPTPDEDNRDGSRVFNIDDGDDNTDSSVTISGLTLTGGDVSGTGGAILTRETLTVNSSTISGNSAGSLGSIDSRSGGGIWALDTVNITDSTISGNSTNGIGGGISGGYVTVTDSTISGNSAPHYGVGGISGGAVTVTNSTISGNSGYAISSNTATVIDSTISGNSGYAISSNTATVIDSTISGNSGDGIRVYPGGQLTIASTTISGNSGNGVHIFQRYRGSGSVITNSTISGNETGIIFSGYDPLQIQYSTITGNNIGVRAIGQNQNPPADPTFVDVFSSIIAGNTEDVRATPAGSPVRFRSLGYNLVGAGSSIHTFTNNDQTGVTDPGLGPLGDNGGPTQTHALLPGSPALDAGDPAVMAGLGDVPQYDQRGAPFLRIAGGRIDIGAFELQTLGDMNFDGDVDFDDIEGFVLGLNDPIAYEVQYGVATSVQGDMDNDGDQDFDDIDDFVQALVDAFMNDANFTGMESPDSDGWLGSSLRARSPLQADAIRAGGSLRSTPGARATQDSARMIRMSAALARSRFDVAAADHNLNSTVVAPEGGDTREPTRMLTSRASLPTRHVVHQRVPSRSRFGSAVQTRNLDDNQLAAIWSGKPDWLVHERATAHKWPVDRTKKT